ncbi:MAG: hypothetical protein FJ404_18685, partial [Verrucomicrobia bacterium]|nr:hypothetical protein [Verrucomicrobiota bacterium]
MDLLQGQIVESGPARPARRNRIANQKPSEAFSKVQAALQLQPNHLNAMRTIAKLLSVGPPNQAFPVWRALLNHPESGLLDHLDWINYTIKIGKPEASGHQVETMLRLHPMPTQVLAAAARWHEASGNLDLAQRFALETLRRTPEDANLLLLICRIQQGSASADERRQSLHILMGLSQRPDAQGLEALEMLSIHAETPAEFLPRILASLQAHPRRTPRHALFEGELRIRINPAQSAILVQEMLASALTNSNVQVETARWLNRRRSFAEVEKLFAATRTPDRDLWLAYLDALAAQKRWTRIRERLEQASLPLEKSLIELFRFRCALELKEEHAVPLRFEQTLAAAGQDPAKLWFQFQYLEKLGLTAYAKRTLLALKKTESSPKPVYLALLRILELEGKLSSLIELVREMTQKFPSDLEPQNDLAYL